MNIMKPWDERRDLALPGNKEATIEFCTKHFIDTANFSIKDHGAFYVALSGGSTPKAIFKNLASESFRSQVDWSKVYLFWSDERSVGPDHEDSNYHMAMTFGFQSLPVKKDHIFRMVAEENLESNALVYENTIKKVVKDSSFDLIMLGMGEDGHTASLFPNTEALKEKTRFVVPNFIPEKDSWRMTFTFPLINQAKHIAIYVLGASKAHRLKDVLSQKNELSYPSAKVGTNQHKALWICDSEASSLLV